MLTNAKWITAPQDMGAAATTFSCRVSPKKKIEKAVLYASAVGVYNFRPNNFIFGNGYYGRRKLYYGNRLTCFVAIYTG